MNKNNQPKGFRPMPKADWFHCRTCGKKSEGVLRFKNLPFTACIKCGVLTLPPEAIEQVVGKKDAPRIITPQQSGLIVPPGGK